VSTGSLVLVATPIGNLGDLSPRAVEAIAQADVVACEDTRRTRKLLSHAGVKRVRLLAVHDHNESAQARAVLSELDRGSTVAVVSDAGTPALSDPGWRLVAAAAGAGHKVVAVPGASAALAALVTSALPTARWCFEGFLPRRGAERRRRLEEIARERRTIVIFEAPHRLAATLSDLAEVCGSQRAVAVARELTKVHEEVWRGTVGHAAALALAERPRGEQVVVLAGAPPPGPPGAEELESRLNPRLAAGESMKEAAAAVAGELGIPRRVAYDAAIRVRESKRHR
jgi:16S rRNA (cytidine1402-2'-O)-methyltransferase